jgi:hypothetical protein
VLSLMAATPLILLSMSGEACQLGGPNPVTNQVTTYAASRPGRTRSDSAIGLTSRYPAQIDGAGASYPAWHARGPGFESP